MKKLIVILFVMGLLTACTQTEDYKTARAEVLKIHDDVMMDTEQAFKNKMQLDTLALKLDSLKKIYTGIDTLKERTEINSMINRLNQADDEMNTWMHQFDAELGEKSDKEATDYFKAERNKVDKLDSLYKQVIRQSDNYLKKFGGRK